MFFRFGPEPHRPHRREPELAGPPLDGRPVLADDLKARVLNLFLQQCGTDQACGLAYPARVWDLVDQRKASGSGNSV